MLAETGDSSSLRRKDFIYEPKLDGVRCIATLNDSTRLQARSGNDITEKFPELLHLHRQARKPCILDGEIVSLNFNAIQHRIHQENPLSVKVVQGQYPAFYFVFDILQAGRESVMSKPLIERKVILASLFIEDYHGRSVGWQTGYGESLFEKSRENNLEGIMAKAMYSSYLAGKRSPCWLKIKNFREDTFYVCGITEGENDRSSTFGSLILGELVDGRMVYMSNCGSGFTERQLKLFLALLSRMAGDCPFGYRVDAERPVKLWTRPELQVEVRYLERTPEGKLRFPTFRRLIQRG
jgi:ATP-dependent DNA ligase